MSAALATAEPTQTQGPQDRGTNRHAPLLGLIRKIVAYGRDLVAALQRQNTAAPTMQVALCFGTFNLALIIARITRGLAIAARLEARLSRTGRAHTPTQDRPTKPAKTRPARPEPPRPPKLSQAEDDAALLRGLPSAQEIAARIRRRPAGAVIEDICRDLGINATHALWRDIQDAIIAHDGSMARMLNIWMAQAAAYAAAPLWGGQPPSFPLSPSQEATLQTWATICTASTGPP